MKKNEEIVVNLKTEEEHESVRNLSDADKKNVDRIKEKLRAELGIEILKEMERQEQLEKAKEQQSQQASQPAQHQQSQAREQTAESTTAKPKVERVNLAEIKAEKEHIVPQQKQQVTQPAQHKPTQPQQPKASVKPASSQQASQVVTGAKPVNEDKNFTPEKLNERVNSSKTKSTEVIKQPANNTQKRYSISAEQLAKKRYSQFMEQYSKKEEIVDVASVGKYDSELDFQLNRKIKKVRFPLPKYAKILLCCLAVLILAASGFGIAKYLYKEPPEILLTKVTMSQPISNDYYVVNNVYVGDKLNCSNIYLNCEYSDGSVQEVALTRDMIKVATTKVNSNDIFTEAGDAIFQVKYKDKTLNLKYVVEQKVVQSISLFTPSATNTYDIVATTNTLDIQNSVIVNAKYSNGVTQRIDINECSYKIAGMPQPVKIQNGTITLSGVNNGQSYEVVISYGKFTASFKIFVNINNA